MVETATYSIARSLRRGITSFTRRLFPSRDTDALRQLLRETAQTMRPLNVILGAGSIEMPGWLATDATSLDVTVSRDWETIFSPSSIDRLMAEHLFEHLSDEECDRALKACFRYLKPGGLLRLAVPDGNRKDEVYVAEVSPPKDGHQILFTVDELVRRLVQVGFHATPLEYFDLREEFHCSAWDEADGLIRRSVRYDSQEPFKRGLLYYTSLIVDAKKPCASLDSGNGPEK